MNISKKVLIILLALAIIITAITMAAVFVPAVGKWFSTTFGGAGAGLVNLAQMPLKFALSGGAQTFALYGIGFLILFGFAYWVWHWDIGYKLQGAASTTENKLTDYATQREPDEPETHANTTTTT